MQKALEKVKPILYLLTLSITAFGIVWIVNQFKDTNTYVTNEISTQGEILVDETASQFVSIEEITPMEVTQDTVGQVLAADPSESNQCKEAFNTYSSVEICTVSSDKVDYKVKGESEGEYVRKNANIQLTSISVPLVLLSGSNTVKDTNRKITTDDPLYKPAGEQFTYKEVNLERIPGDTLSANDFIIRRPFGTNYSIAFGQAADNPPDKGKAVIEKTVENDCEYCNNESNPNPDKTNKISEYLYGVRYKIPGGNPAPDDSKEDELKSCSSKDTYRVLDDTGYSACKVGLLGYVEAVIRTRISAPIFNECKQGFREDEDGNILPPSDNCMRSEDIIVKISSMFGSDYECVDGVCTNAYMNVRNKTALSPIDSESYSDNVYYLTPCDALVDGEALTVKCAWDLSYLFKERKVAEFDDVIGVEKTPSKSAYDRFLLQDAADRNGEPAVEM